MARFVSLFLGGAVALALTVCTHAAQPAVSLQPAIDHLAAIAKPGIFGIAVIDLQTGGHWSVDGSRAFPMMSDFKAPVAAAVLAQVDTHRLSLTQKITLEPADYVPGSAVPSIGAQLARGRMVVTLAQLLHAAITQSDNTSCDALIRIAGGPAVITRFLRSHGITETRIVTGEGGIAAIFEDRGSAAAKQTPAQQEQRMLAGYKAFIAAPPNITTPNAAAMFLVKLWKGEMLSHASTAYLLKLMDEQTIPQRLRAGVPAGYRFADKTGTSATVDGYTAAYNDTGILTAPDGRTIVITAFLSQSDLRVPDRDALFATLTRDAVAALLTPPAH